MGSTSYLSGGGRLIGCGLALAKQESIPLKAHDELVETRTKLRWGPRRPRLALPARLEEEREVVAGLGEGPPGHRRPRDGGRGAGPPVAQPPDAAVGGLLLHGEAAVPDRALRAPRRRVPRLVELGPGAGREERLEPLQQGAEPVRRAVEPARDATGEASPSSRQGTPEPRRSQNATKKAMRPWSMPGHTCVDSSETRQGPKDAGTHELAAPLRQVADELEDAPPAVDRPAREQLGRRGRRRHLRLGRRLRRAA